MKPTRSSVILPAVLLLILTLLACDRDSQKENLDMTLLSSAFEQYQEKSITQRRFKHEDVIHLVNNRNSGFEVAQLGQSVEGKPIYQMSMGTGPVKVLLWSQMHGNESTATMALFDLFNFLEGENDSFDDLRYTLLKSLTIRIIPIVNPDGMDRWIRRNALDIDLNRDAARLSSPEAVILKNARDEFAPDFGFNLHDQQVYYTAGESAKPAAISVLAPAYNAETEVNEVRKRAMQVIVGMNRLLQQIEPGYVGKYDDAFEPRAFGDNFQKWGTSTILIESGGYPNDPEKQHIRKLNFMIMLNALYQIATNTYPQYSLEEYYGIPDNSIRLMDVMIRNLPYSQGDFNYPLDIGIRRRESETESGFFVTGSIEDIGDLSVFYGYEEVDASQMQIVEGKVFGPEFENLDALDHTKALEILRQGFLAVKVKEVEDRALYDLPLLVLKSADSIPFGIRTGGMPNFFLSQQGKLRYAIVNGYLVDLEKEATQGYWLRVN
jgi:hypothetical protein